MPRKRQPDRIDKIADAATATFIRDGFALAKVSQIAHAAGVGPGTLYLYAEGKEALFDLALRRAFEDPTLWDLKLPHPSPLPGALADHLWRCLQNAAHFPLLWLGTESPPPEDPAIEVEGILRELYSWLFRYRRGIQLLGRCAGDWPEAGQVFHRRFWRGGVRRIGDYLVRRMSEGAIPARGDGLASAHFVVESVAWMAVHREWSADGADISGDLALRTTLELLVPALTHRNDHS
ncbi:MAG: TetR/AcrR family transcriptional regulator [Gemmatimonadales bacterium]|nr:TetR/AcrR family transcriptional regulator [Gemmatimonadales bacterium]